MGRKNEAMQYNAMPAYASSSTRRKRERGENKFSFFAKGNPTPLHSTPHYTRNPPAKEYQNVTLTSLN